MSIDCATNLNHCTVNIVPQEINTAHLYTPQLVITSSTSNNNRYAKIAVTLLHYNRQSFIPSFLLLFCNKYTQTPTKHTYPTPFQVPTRLGDISVMSGSGKESKEEYGKVEGGKKKIIPSMD